MNLLKQYRQSNNLSQVELSQLLGINQSDLSDYENGKKRPRPDRAKLISEKTGISKEYLVFGE